MFYDFRKIAQEKNIRGWRLEEENQEIFLSKFDDKFNDDEYRVYIELTSSGIEITRTERIKNYKKIVSVKPDHPHVRTARQLCDAYWEKYSRVHN